MMRTEKATLINSAIGHRMKQILGARVIGESALPDRDILSA
jgi:hypothetical protein